MSRQDDRHLIDDILKHALNGVFIFSLMEAIVPILLRGRWTPAIPRDMETLIASNLSVENQNEHKNWLAKYLGEWSWRLRNFSQEVGGRIAKTACIRHSQGSSKTRLAARSAKCATQLGSWLLGLCNARFQLRNTDGPRKNLHKILGQAAADLQKCEI